MKEVIYMPDIDITTIPEDQIARVLSNLYIQGLLDSDDIFDELAEDMP